MMKSETGYFSLRQYELRQVRRVSSQLPAVKRETPLKQA
jgi:hypothetical protein